MVALSTSTVTPHRKRIGRPMTLVLPADRTDEETEILQRIGRGERVEHFETVRRTKSGSLIEVSLTISPVLDETGRILGASHVARNITDRRRLDERLQHLAAVVESSEDAIISKTLDGTILTWNTGAETIYGYPAAETIGRPMTLLLPANRADEETEILQRIGRGERVEHFETVRRTKSGSLIEVSLTISPVIGKDGRIRAPRMSRVTLPTANGLRRSCGTDRNSKAWACSRAVSLTISTISLQVYWGTPRSPSKLCQATILPAGFCGMC